MKKFTLFLLSMFCMLGTAVAQDSAFKLESVTPSSEGTVASVDYIQLIFSKDAEVVLPEGGIAVTNEETKEVYNLTTRNQFAPKNYVVLHFEQKANDKGDMEAQVITAPGKYSYTIPAGCITSVDGEEFAEQTFTFTVDNPFALVFSDPSSDVPASNVQIIQHQFSKDVTVTLPENPIIIKHKESNDQYKITNGMAYGPNAVFYLEKIEELAADQQPTTSISAVGTYNYTIPAGVITSVDGEAFPETTFTFSVCEPLEVVSYSPQGEVTTLEKIELTFNKAIAKVEIPRGGLSLVDYYWTPIANIKSDVVISEDKKTVTLELETPLTDPGQYYLDIYEGVFTSEDGAQNEYVSYIFNVIDPTPAFIVNYEDGEKVKELGDLQITFKNVNEVKLVEGGGDVMVYLPGGGELTGTANLVDNVINVSFGQPMTEDGDYTFVIPAGMFTMDGVANEERVINVTLFTFEVTELKVVGVTPVEGEVTQLDRIVIEFNQDVTLSFDENWQMISNEIVLKGEDKDYKLTYNSMSNLGTRLEYLVNAEWTGYEYAATPITTDGKYTLDLSQVVVNHAAEQGIDEWGYPATIWHEKNKRCEGTFTWTIVAGESSIEDIVVENGEKAIYDLTGRRVENVTNAGIYIVNGKKVLVK